MEASPVASTTASCRADGKIFVGGLPWEATEDTMKEYFMKYGEVEEAIILRDKIKGYSRGFGFVTFCNSASAEAAINASSHSFLGKVVEVKKAVPKAEKKHQLNQQQHQNLNFKQHPNWDSNKINGSCNGEFRTKRMFVGGLPSNITVDEFKWYFQRFGEIVDVIVMHDSSTHRPRGFGFITFDSEDDVEEAVRGTFHLLNGKIVEAKKALPRNCNYNSPSPNSHNGHVAGIPDDNYQKGYYPPYSPMYQANQVYVPPSVYAGGHEDGYTFKEYGGLGYAPYFGLQGMWYCPVMGGAIWSPVLYGNIAYFPQCLNGGVGLYYGMGQ